MSWKKTLNKIWKNNRKIITVHTSIYIKNEVLAHFSKQVNAKRNINLIIYRKLQNIRSFATTVPSKPADG